MASPETKYKATIVSLWRLGNTKLKEVWQWCFCSSPETNTFHHITAPLIHQRCQMFAHSTISFSWLIQNADDFSFIVLLHDFFFTAFCAFFFFFFCTQARRLITPPTMKCLQPWWCNGIVTLCPGTLAPAREDVAMRALTPCWYCGTIREKGALVCVSACVCVCFQIMTFTTPFPRTFTLIHLWSLNAPLSIRIKMPQWNTHTLAGHILWVKPSAGGSLIA